MLTRAVALFGSLLSGTVTTTPLIGRKGLSTKGICVLPTTPIFDYGSLLTSMIPSRCENVRYIPYTPYNGEAFATIMTWSAR